METALAFIGFGEAAQAFASGLHGTLSGYDVKTDEPTTRAAKQADFDRLGVKACRDAAEALAGAGVVLSLVTAEAALAAAQAGAASLAVDALWLDMNSVAPDTKMDAAAAVAPFGRYVDVAVMAPVHSARLDVPLLVAGPHAAAGAAALSAMGFRRVRIVGDRVGQASAIKMIRSVMVKGLEALSAECALAAAAAGVLDEVIASLDASETPRPWAERFDYNLDRMMVHGQRRAAEMTEVVRTLDMLGTGSPISRATADRQYAIGRLGIAPPAGLDAKLSILRPFLSGLEAVA